MREKQPSRPVGEAISESGTQYVFENCKSSVESCKTFELTLALYRSTQRGRAGRARYVWSEVSLD